MSDSVDDSSFEVLERTFQADGADAALDLLIRTARDEKNCSVLFGARNLQIRHRLGLPLIETETVRTLPPGQQLTYETALREAAREAGELLLSAGNIAGAWAYFKAIGDAAPVAASIEAVTGGEDLDRIIEIAFQEGVNPRKGFELILERHGICRAITWFPANQDSESRQKCLRLLVNHLYSQLVSSIKETIASAEGSAPATGNLAELMAGRDWLFEGNSSYTDSTHVASVLQYSPELQDRETQRMALEIAEYGCKLGSMFHFRGEPPFEEPYLDHAVYLQALLGEDVDAAIAHFRQKAEPSVEFPGFTAPAEVLIDLLVRMGRPAEAIQASLECLPEAGAANCPSVLQLCQMAGDFDKLRSLAKQRKDLLGFAAGVIQR